MAEFLIVPMQVEALFLPETRALTEASADFTRIPYCNSLRDINPDIAYLSEEIVSHPFQNQNLFLRAGVHLHWFLPEALTRGTVDSQGSTFPAVPDRWLVTRMAAPGLAQKQWVVESSYLHPEGQGEGCVAFPLPNSGITAPFRRLGRCLTLEEWLQQKAPTPGQYLDSLTAIGYGELTFAAFYPNCHSVFGFCDAEIADAYPAGLEYRVVGWYANPGKDDFLQQYLQQKQPKDWDAFASCLREDFAWEMPGSSGQPLPRRMACAGAVCQPVQQFPGEVEKIALANSGMEALSAYLAQSITGGQLESKVILEDQLEYVSFQPNLVNHRADLDAKFLENRLERTFDAVYGGAQWMIRLENQEKAANAAGEQEPLPLEFARLLGDLNQQQRAFDHSLQELNVLRGQLFSDWYKYMLCAYPPEGAADDYPDIDQVKYFIETQDLRQLDEKIELNAGLGRELMTRLNALRQAVDPYNQAHPNGRCLVELVPAARYWQPKEPVILIVDELGSPLLQPQAGPLRCQVVAVPESSAQTPRTGLDSLLAQVQPAVRTVQPWHSLFLEWQTQYYPLRAGSNVYPRNRNYSDSYIAQNYTLPENAVELERSPESKPIKGAQIYSGYSILTPYAGFQLEQTLARYLAGQPQFQTRYQAWCAEKDDGSESLSFQQWLGDNIEAELAWYASTSVFSGELDPTYTFLRAVQALQKRVFLSQALSGFNDALLMHKQTMQLPIADPLGFPEYQQFAERVRRAIAGEGIQIPPMLKDFNVLQSENLTAPQPQDEFNPIRAGALNLLHLRLIDTFGRVKAIYPGLKPKAQEVIPAKTIAPQEGDKYHALLPPRLVQPARLQLRWLAAGPDPKIQRETNAHPATSPVCGWLLPSIADQSLQVYDPSGEPLGALKADPYGESPGALWLPAPGSQAGEIRAIPSPALQKVIAYIAGKGDVYLKTFLDTLGNVLDNISPEKVSQYIGLPLFIGRPVAVVRASLNLELLGRPAVHQGWNVFRQDLNRQARDTNAFDDVKFCIRLGDASQQDDGLVSCFREDAQGALSELVFCDAQGSLVFNKAINDPQVNLTLLLDPRAKLHAACGILPVKAIDIPAECYTDVIKNLTVTFLSAPILTCPDQVNLPVPAEPGYQWTWLENQAGVWSEKEINPPGSADDALATIEIREGWLKLKPAS